MKKSGPLLVPIILFLLWAVLAWFLGLWLGVNPQLLWVLRGGLWLIGIAGVGGYFILATPRAETLDEHSPEFAASQIDTTFAAAAKLLPLAEGVKKINSLPAIFLLGEKGSAKTSSMNKSGIEPELLSGSRSLNIWYARHTVFVDPSGSAFADERTRKRLFKKFMPVKMPRMNFPARSVVLLVDCELFLNNGGAPRAAEQADQYHGILSELANELQCNLPVYVLFTKADKISHFSDYAENLSESEAAEVLGVSLPVPAGEGLQPNSDVQFDRVTNAFKSVAWALAERRSLYLAREQNAGKLANIYEFPREFAKLRPLIVEFLVDVCRQNLAATVPYLRGFYFTGERDARPGVSAKPIYMQRLFSDVFMADRAAAATAPLKKKARKSPAMRWSLAAVALAGLALSAWLLDSFRHNSALVQEALDDSRPSATDSLERLSRMRETLMKLNEFEKRGVPWNYDALLYKGYDIRGPLRLSYFALFRRMLLEPAQQTLLKICTNPKNYDSQGYQFVYDALKAYLVTTIHHEKSVPAFLTPVLVRNWRSDKAVSAERENLARENFAFYAEELARVNPYSSFTRLDATAVQNAREYLNGFEPQERIYKEMLVEAAIKERLVMFNQDFPGSSATVINEYPVDAWFTKAAYQNFQRELQDLDRYISSEKWVLGQEGPRIPDKKKLADTLRERFDDEFTEAWTGFITATTLVHFDTIPDAATKLRNLSSPDSPLLMDLCVASENIDGADQNVKAAFQPVQLITPAGCTKQLVSPVATPYLGSLNELAIGLTAVGPISQARADDVKMAVGMTRAAENAVKQITQGFKVDPQDPASPVRTKVVQLLKEPVARAEGLLKAPITNAVQNQ